MKNQMSLPQPCPQVSSSETVDSWIPMTPLGKMAETDYDVLIVGSGAGGGLPYGGFATNGGTVGKK
jgi:hypothetical protein